MKKVARRLLNEILFQSPCPPRRVFPRDVVKIQSMTTHVTLALSYSFFSTARCSIACVWLEYSGQLRDTTRDFRLVLTVYCTPSWELVGSLCNSIPGSIPGPGSAGEDIVCYSLE